MRDRSAAILHNLRVDIEALVTERLAMIAANHAREFRREPPKYDEQAFMELEKRIRGCGIDPTHFD